MKIEADSAQVKIPPPLMLLISIAIAIGLRFVIDWPVFSGRGHYYVGGALIVGAFALFFKAVPLFRKHHTKIAPWETTTTIISEGPYRFTRNPIYLSFILLSLGTALLANHWLSFLGPADLSLFLHFYVIPREEKYLLEKFGESYATYYRSTRRWL